MNQHINIRWSERPGCFERHLQRRYNNPLFTPERQLISSEEFNQAIKKDNNNLKEFIKQYALWLSGAKNLNENSSIDDLQSCLQDAQYLAELVATVGGDLENEIFIIETMEQKIISFMDKRVPQGAELLKQAKSLSVVKRIPYFAQIGIQDSPVLKNEELASLLSEDIETIKIAGLVSNSFAEYRPNSKDVQELLDKAVKKGLDKEYAKKVMDAFLTKETLVKYNSDFSNGQRILHFVILYFTTFGLYIIYWSYRNWRDFKKYYQKDISPGWRTLGLFVPILGLFFMYYQFRDIKDYAKKIGIKKTNSPVIDIFSFVILKLFFLGFVALISPQNTLNEIWAKEQPDLKMRKTFSKGEKIWLIIFVGFIVLVALLE